LETRDNIIGTHVDDLIGIAPQGKGLDKVEASCKKSVELEKRGKPRKIVGMEAMWNQEETEVIITQKSLIETMSATYLPAETRDPRKSSKKTLSTARQRIFRTTNGRRASGLRKMQVPSDSQRGTFHKPNDKTRHISPSQSPGMTEQQSIIHESEGSPSHFEVFMANAVRRGYLAQIT